MDSELANEISKLLSDLGDQMTNLREALSELREDSLRAAYQVQYLMEQPQGQGQTYDEWLKTKEVDW
jgi:hypothetical protein